MKFSSRLYQNDRDYNKIKDLIKEIISIQGTPFYGSVGDFEFWVSILSEKDEIFNSKLYFNSAEKLIAFFWPSDSSFDVFIHPEYKEVFSQIMAESELKSNISKISCGVFNGEHFKEKVLLENEFKASNKYSIHYELNLHNYKSKSHEFHQKLKITALSNLEKINSKLECYKNCFPEHQPNKEKYISMMKCSSYNPEFDLVLINNDEKVLSFATIWVDTENSIGVFEPVGTHEDFRGQGLAKAIMTFALNKLKENNIKKAYLKTGHNNCAAQTVYQSLDFKAIAREYRWKKYLS